MNQLVLQRLLTVLIPTAIAVAIATAWIRDLPLTEAGTWFKVLPSTVTVTLFITAAFVTYGWKLPIFQKWLVIFPDLSGTWTGEIHSSFKQRGQEPAPIPTTLTITQNFFSIHCKLVTDKRTSHSYGESLTRDEEKQINRLTYLYDSKTDVHTARKNPPHEGAVRFEIEGVGEAMTLRGTYWTSAKTNGTMVLTRKNK